MELDIVDQLLICLVDQPHNVPLLMRERGYTQEQISEACDRGLKAPLHRIDRVRHGSAHGHRQVSRS